MRPSYRSGFGASLAVIAYCQRPFRFIQLGRTICGRGYSGHTFWRLTDAAQRVGIETGCIFQSCATASLAMRRPVTRFKATALFMAIIPKLFGRRRVNHMVDADTGIQIVVGAESRMSLKAVLPHVIFLPLASRGFLP